MQKSTPMFFTNKGIRAGKEQTRQVWDYQLTSTDGKTYEAYGRSKRQNFKNGQVVMAVLSNRGSDSAWIQQILTTGEFMTMVGRAIDHRRNMIKDAEEEISRLRAL